MAKLIKSFWLLSALICLASGCSPKRVADKPRSFVPDLSKSGNSKPLPNITYTPLGKASSGSCERLQALVQAPASTTRGFQFFNTIAVDDKRNLTGALDIDKSPFIQYLLGESADKLGIKITSKEDFLKAAADAYAKGEVSGFSYEMLQVAKYVYDHQNSAAIGVIEWMLKAAGYDLDQIQEDQTNGKIEQTFPGIFGKPVALDKSLYLLLLTKLDSKLNLPSTAISQLLETKIELYAGDDWTSYRDDSKATLEAAMQAYAYDPAQPQTERLCSFELMKRSFTQLLGLKGYIGVNYTEQTSGPAVLPKLTQQQKMFPQVNMPGAFVDPNGERVVLSPDQIRAYDAVKTPLYLAQTLPVEKIIADGTVERASLANQLQFLEGAIYNFEATSPAAPWISGIDSYMLGDITNTKNRASIPGDAHSLAFGLLVMEFKNLAARNIIQINDNDKALAPGDSAAGVVVVDDDGKTVSLANVIQLAKDVALLGESLQEFVSAQKDPDAWTAFNSFYDKKTLASVFGRAMFSEQDLEQILPSQADRDSILLDKVQMLDYPLAALALKLARANLAEMSWDPSKGFDITRDPVSSESMAEVKSTLERLAIDTRSPALFNAAQSLSP